MGGWPNGRAGTKVVPDGAPGAVAFARGRLFKLFVAPGTGVKLVPFVKAKLLGPPVKLVITVEPFVLVMAPTALVIGVPFVFVMPPVLVKFVTTAY